MNQIHLKLADLPYKIEWGNDSSIELIITKGEDLPSPLLLISGDSVTNGISTNHDEVPDWFVNKPLLLGKL